MTKQELRNQIKTEIKENAQQLPELSAQLCKKIINSEIYKNSPVILAYSPLPDEADIKPVITHALQNGKKVFLPKITPGSDFMEFLQYDEKTLLAKGSFGILEPNFNYSCSNLFKFSDFLDTQVLVLVPGRAFTTDGNRLGRGKGFYDKYFSQKPQNLHLAGVCFPFQIKKELPSSSNDVLMDFLF